MSNYESGVIKRVFEKYVDKESSVLDVACGLGDKMLLLQNCGYSNLLGVEINDSSIRVCKQKGLNVSSFSDFEADKNSDNYDVILMSHIIEHFEYRELIEFMETYLQCLKPDGLLIIVTPVLHSCFYDAFDHVKPYSHIGIMDIFGDKLSTEPCKSKLKLKMLDLYYIRNAYQLKFYRALALGTNLYRIPRTINRLLHLVYRLSFRTIGEPAAWIGVFQRKG